MPTCARRGLATTARRRRRVAKGIDLPGIENHLRAAEERDGAPGIPMAHDGVPDLGRAPEVNDARNAIHDAFAGRAEMVGLEFHGREAGGSLRQIRHASVAGGSVGQCDHAAGMQETIGCHQRLADDQFGSQLALAYVENVDAEEAGQVSGTALVEFLRGQHEEGEWMFEVTARMLAVQVPETRHRASNIPMLSTQIVCPVRRRASMASNERCASALSRDMLVRDVAPAGGHHDLAIPEAGC